MLRWDVFCRVIDNFGDIGVCWRLCAALAARGHSVRFWVDDASPLAWMAPDGCPGVEVRPWQSDQPMPLDAQPGDVVIEAFGCEINYTWIAMKKIASHAYSVPANAIKAYENTLKKPIWINLEYLSAESYARRSHGLPSPVMAGAAQGMAKWFFYPGFTPGTGGLIRESGALATPSALVNSPRRISLFCYEPAAITELLQRLADAEHPTLLIALAGRGQRALHAAFQVKSEEQPAWNMRGMLLIKEQTYIPQQQYDTLLSGCDLNFVRGEDSLVRALWAGRAFVWQIYPQADGAHAAKLEAFLDWLQAPPDLRAFHRVWNGLSDAILPAIDLKAWQECALAARSRCLDQRDLVSQLIDFVQEKQNLRS